MAKKTPQQNSDDLAKSLKIQREINDLIEQERAAAFGITNAYREQQRVKSEQRKILDEIRVIQERTVKSSKDLSKTDEERIKQLGKQNAELEKQVQRREQYKKLEAGLLNTTKTYLGYLMQADKAIRQTNLNLGITGQRADMVRKNFEDSAVQLANLGLGLSDLGEIQSAYADETGRQTLLYKESAVAIGQIAKGTTLGAEGAAKLAGQLELMGYNAENTNKTVQAIVDSSEKFGVNSNRILKSMNANFKRFSSYGFKTGVAGMSDMAMYGEKFKVSMESTLNAADKARTLEGAVDMASKLQILGGEFAKSDPFKFLHDSRNDPAKFMQSINEMTKGMATMKKTADGFSFELASPQARDMIAQAAQALGMSTEELTEQAIQMNKIQEMRRQTSGIGILSKEDRDTIEGMAQFEKSTGKFYVSINGVKKGLSELGKEELNQLKVQKTSLEDRAKNAQTFDEQLNITLQELKATFLPILRGINSIFEQLKPIFKTVTSLFDSVPEWGKQGMAMVAGLGLVTAGLFKAGSMLKSTFGMIKGAGGLLSGGAGKGIASAVGKGAGEAIGGGAAAAGGAASKGGGGIAGAMKGINPKTLLAAGAAALMFGAGIGIAAKGISELSKSLKDLDPEQLATLKDIMLDMTVMFGAFALGLTVVAFAGGAAAEPLMAFGGAVLLIGGGIGIAAAGIGYMATGMAELMKTIDPNTVTTAALGIAGIAGSLALMSTTGLIGLLALGGTLALLSSYSDDMERIGNAFGNIAVVLNSDGGNLQETANAIKTIAEADIGNNSALSKLAEMMNKPLKVEFDKKEVALNVNTTLNVDGKKLATMSNLKEHVTVEAFNSQKGKS
ncbi:MAG: hypothetical protein HC836_28135 [Richelia sp. RM2_1_2]|nr:hypothetical protein [Richelia sp. RM2_1_2]